MILAANMFSSSMILAANMFSRSMILAANMLSSSMILVANMLNSSMILVREMFLDPCQTNMILVRQGSVHCTVVLINDYDYYQ